MSDTAAGLLIAKNAAELSLLPGMASRHGLVAGATGTGKTVTLQVLAEAFSRVGVPVFAADIKGDLSGITQPGGGNAKVDDRVAQLGLSPWPFEGSPAMFWDVFGEQGHPVRTTASEVGPAAARAHAQPQRHPGGRAHASPSAWPTTTASCCSTSTTCAPSSSSSPTTRPRRRHHLRQRLRRLRRGHPALAAHARGAGRAEVLRRARPRPLRLHADRRPGTRLRQHPRRGQAHDGAQGLLHPAALAAQRALRAAARGRRPAQAQAGLLLRRGAPAVHRRAAGAARPRSSRWYA